MSTIPQHSDSAVSKAQEPVSLGRKILGRLRFSRRSHPGHKRKFSALPQTPQDRLDASLNDAPIDTDKLDTDKLAAESGPVLDEKNKTVLYLAYGSNLCNETFRGVRGIKPLSQVNVVVPSLRLTFDLPGVPYSEPCFANTARRNPDGSRTPNGSPSEMDYRKDRWHKGLVGVVYEVTLSDYAHIIATEGGGSAYKDILIDCHVLPYGDTVPLTPTTKPFKAHTLFAPAESAKGPTHSSERATRPDPSYAQPSARYLKLITDGATECDLPTEYREYLHDIRPYTITTKRQAIGKAIFLATWFPFIMLVFTLSRQLQDKKGRAPKWLGWLSAMVFKGMWLSYDRAFKPVFGDGERTIGDETSLKGAITKRESYWDTEKEGLLEDAVNTLDSLATDESNLGASRIGMV